MRICQNQHVLAKGFQQNFKTTLIAEVFLKLFLCYDKNVYLIFSKTFKINYVNLIIVLLCKIALKGRKTEGKKL